MGPKKLLIPILLCAFLSFACAYIVVPADLLVTPTSVASKGWSGIVTGTSTTGSGDLHIDLAIENDTQDWSSMQADPSRPAVLTGADGKKTNCATVFASTGGTSLAPGFIMQGFASGQKSSPTIQMLYVECKGAAAPAGAKLSIEYNYITGPYDLHVPSIPVHATMVVNLGNVVADVKYPVANAAGTIEKVGDKIPAINSFTVTLMDVKRTETGLEMTWQDENPSDYPNYVHIGTPPVIGADGIIYGVYEDPSIADATITLSKSTAEWTTTVPVPAKVTGLYVLVSVETRQSKYFISHAIDITNK